MFKSAHPDANLYKRELIDNIIQIFKEANIFCFHKKHRDNKKTCYFIIDIANSTEKNFYNDCCHYAQIEYKSNYFKCTQKATLQNFCLQIAVNKTNEVTQILSDIYEFALFIKKAKKEIKEKKYENLSN